MEMVTEISVPHPTEAKRISSLKAIRLKYLDCCCGSAMEVKRCAAQTCALWPFRLGKNPNRKGLGNLANFAMTAGTGHDER